MLRVLANEQRLLVICHLSSAGELRVSELQARMEISQSALSQHLARLRAEGLVDFRRESQSLVYRVAVPRAARVLALLQQLYCPDIENGETV